jgi:ABC-type glycerol-3-phosphate transport system substrate-binding protein
MQRKSGFVCAVFGVSLLAVIVGCRRLPDDAPPFSPWEGRTLTVACPADQPAAADIVQRYSQAWQSRRRAKVEIVRYDPAKGPATTPADVWVLAAAEMPHWASQGALTPLPEEIVGRDAGYGWNSLLPLYRDRLLTWGRDAGGRPTAYAVPLMGDAPLCCYRTDVFGKDHEPETWEEIAAVEAHGLSRLPPLPADDAQLERLFYTVAAGYARRVLGDDAPPDPQAQFSFYYDYQTGEPRIADAGFVEALRLLQRLLPPGEATATPEEAFLAGRASFCVTQARWLPAFKKDQKRVLKGRFGVCAAPGGSKGRAPYLGADAWLAAVPKAAREADAAFDLLADLTGKDDSMQILQDAGWAGGAVRVEQLGDGVRWDFLGLDRLKTAATRAALQQALLHRGVKNPVVVLRIPDAKAHRAALVVELRAALKDPKADAKTALERVAAAWRELDAKRGGDVGKEYRMSLGLETANGGR